MKNYNLYKDSLHGIEVACQSENSAWVLIRNECYNRGGLQVPTFDQIEKVRTLTDKEMKTIRERQLKQLNNQ